MKNGNRQNQILQPKDEKRLHLLAVGLPAGMSDRYHLITNVLLLSACNGGYLSKMIDLVNHIRHRSQRHPGIISGIIHSTISPVLWYTLGFQMTRGREVAVMTETKANPQEASLGYWVFRLNRAMYAEFTRRLSQFGISSPQWTVLSQCGTRAMTPVELADYMQIDRAAVTRLITQLEKKKLLCKKPHPMDGRSSYLSLTAKGRALLPALIDISKSTNHEFLTLLPPKSAQTLLKLLFEIGQRLPGRVFPLASDASGE